MSRPSTPAAPGSLYARFGAALVAEKLRILRTIRGLDRAGVDPATLAQIRTPLVRLAEVDQMLTSVLDVLEREGCASAAPGHDGLVTTLPKLLGIGEVARGEVADALPSRFRRRLDQATGEVAVLEAEIWMQVDELRAKSPPEGRRKRKPRATKPGPMSEAAVRRAADEAWGSARPIPRPEGHAKVVEIEREALPSNAAPLQAWFDRMPASWLQGIARVHDLPVAGAEPLAARIAARFSDPAALRTILTGKMGVSEREKLAIVLSVGLLPLGGPRSDASQAFEVAWDWTHGLPAHVGAKLRALGLVHVGGCARRHRPAAVARYAHGGARRRRSRRRRRAGARRGRRAGHREPGTAVRRSGAGSLESDRQVARRRLRVVARGRRPLGARDHPLLRSGAP